MHREPHVLLDAQGRVIGVLAGRPVDDPTWDKTVQEFAALVEETRQKIRTGAGARTTKSDRRGAHLHSVHWGISYGGGQKVR